MSRRAGQRLRLGDIRSACVDGETRPVMVCERVDGQAVATTLTNMVKAITVNAGPPDWPMSPSASKVNTTDARP